MQLGYAMMITMFEVLQLVETIGKQFPHHHSTNSSRLNDFFVIILFAIHKFSFSVVVTFLLSSFFTSGNFSSHGGWKSNETFWTIFNLFFLFLAKIEARKAAAKEIVFACLVVILFKHSSSSLCLSKSSDIFNYWNSVVVCYRNAIWSSLLKIQ